MRKTEVYHTPRFFVCVYAIFICVFGGTVAHPHDYARAINENTSMMLKVHRSNYQVIGFTKNVTLYPVWKKHTGLYVALVTNGGTIDRYPDNDPEILDVAKKGDTVALPAASRMEREGYTFVGWYSDAALKTKIANPNKVKVNKCRYIYAKWKKK